MNAPGPATAAVVERSGPRAAIALGLVIYVVVVGGLPESLLRLSSEPQATSSTTIM